MRKWLLLTFCVFSFILVAAIPENPPEAAMRTVLRKMELSPAGDIVYEQVKLPPADDKSWGPYLEMQAENGYNMRPYCGKTVQKLSCPVTVRKNGEMAEVHLFFAGEKLIGGDVMTTALDGYMQAILPGVGT